MSNPLKLPTLLVVSDNPTIRFWVKKHLDHQFFILLAEDRKEAFEAAFNSRLDFIILDAALESLDALVLCQELNQLSQKHFTPIFLITGRLNKSYRKQAQKAGVTAFLSEQLDLDELEAAIAKGQKTASMRDKTADLSRSIKTSKDAPDLKHRVVSRKGAKIHLIELYNTPIFEQLQIEEALLRADERSFCIINHGSPKAIVMGSSGEPETLLDVARVKRDRIPVIKRFSGGGTVVVDEETLFITFILSKEHLNVHAFPEPILRWSADLYKEAWNIPHFQLRENDYCIGEKKCGGNAQYIRKDRWLHHTSFLWDYAGKNMNYLLLPSKQPKYRENRSHEEFLTRLKDHAMSKEDLVQRVKKSLVKQLYISEFDVEKWEPASHRQATHFIDL
jgi:lipoate-protein ligase A